MPTGGEIYERLPAAARGNAGDGARHRDRRAGDRGHAPRHGQGHEPRPRRAALRACAIETGRRRESRRDLARAVIDASGTWAKPESARRERPAGRGRGASTPTGSPTAFPTSSAATAPLYAGRKRAGRRRGPFGGQRAARPRAARRSRARHVDRLGGARHQPGRASMAAATPTSCRRAASSAPTSGRWSRAAA